MPMKLRTITPNKASTPTTTPTAIAVAETPPSRVEGRERRGGEREERDEIEGEEGRGLE